MNCSPAFCKISSKMLSVSFTDIGLISILIILCVLFFLNPRWALGSLFSLKFSLDLFWNHSLLGLPVNVLQISGVVFALLSLIYILQHPNLIPTVPFKGLIFLLLISNGLASVWGILNSHFKFFELVASPLSLVHVVEWNFRFLNLLGSFIMIPLIFNQKRDFRKLIIIFMISTIFPVFCGFIEFFFSPHQREISDGVFYSVRIFHRITGGYHDANVFAVILFVGITSGFYLYTEKQTRWKYIFLLYSICSLFLLINTYSRTLWLTTITFFIVFFTIRKKYFSLVVVMLILFLIVFSVPQIPKRFMHEVNYLSNKNTEYLTLEMTGSGRMGLWKQAVDHFVRLDWISKIIGSGGAYGSHNQYIAFLLKNGLMGLILFLSLLFFILRLLFRQCKELSDRKDSLHYCWGLALFLSISVIGNQFIQLWDHVSFTYYFWGLSALLLFRAIQTE